MPCLSLFEFSESLSASVYRPVQQVFSLQEPWASLDRVEVKVQKEREWLEASRKRMELSANSIIQVRCRVGI